MTRDADEIAESVRREHYAEEHSVSEMLKGALGNSYGGPSIGFENGEFILYSWGDAPVSMEIMCKHPDWAEFLKLVAEYSDTVQGDI